MEMINGLYTKVHKEVRYPYTEEHNLSGMREYRNQQVIKGEKVKMQIIVVKSKIN